jgi:hypothetical protein
MSTELEDKLREQLKNTPLAESVGGRSAAEIEALAQDRSRNRVRLTTADGALAFVVATVSGAAIIRHHDGDLARLADQASQPSTTGGTDPGSGLSMRPGCGGAWTGVVSVEGGTLLPPRHDFDSVITATVGSPLVITSGILPHGDVAYIHTLQFVVSPPGTDLAAPGPAEDPANQLATSKVIGGFVSDDQTIELDWTPTEKGRFPMFGLVSQSTSDDCGSPNPDGMVMSGEDPVAVIVVE